MFAHLASIMLQNISQFCSGFGRITPEERRISPDFSFSRHKSGERRNAISYEVIGSSKNGQIQMRGYWWFLSEHRYLHKNNNISINWWHDSNKRTYLHTRQSFSESVQHVIIVRCYEHRFDIFAVANNTLQLSYYYIKRR